MEIIDQLVRITTTFVILPAAFGTLGAIDQRRNLLPDSLTLPLLGGGLLVNLLFATHADFADAAIGCAAGYLVIRLLHDLEILVRNASGIGLGDAKLLAAIGAWFGWRALPIIVVAAAIVMLVVYFSRRDKPFGVGLAMAAVGYGLTVFFASA